MNLHPILWALLSPLSLLFGAIVRLRAWLYRSGILPQRRLNGIVISVGNLTLGGTGKTPMVLWIAQRLLAEGKRVGILARGYRALPVSTTEKNESARPPYKMNDEISLLWTRLNKQVVFGVGANRYARGRELEGLGLEWFVLDDGFQHLRFARDLDIVLIDASNPFGSGRLLPAGLLREPVSALARADIVVITRSNHDSALEAAIRPFTQAPVFYAQTALEGVLERTSGVEVDARQKKLFAFCGIGNPGAFFGDLRRWGFSLLGQAAFADHHRYDQRDFDALERQAKVAGAEAFICTEKDINRPLRGQFHEFPVYFCRISLRPLAPEAFGREVLSVIERKRAGAAR